MTELLDQALVAPGFAYVLSPEDQRFFTEEMRRRCGVSLPDSKAPMIARRLSRRVRSLGLDGFGAYRRLLAGDPHGPEWSEVVSALTTHKTSFFREIHHFRMLADILRSHHDHEPGRIRLWSAACSSGEEPYSMAMTAIHVLGEAVGDLKILATDIDATILDQARDGLYDQDAITQVPRFARAHLEPDGSGGARVSARVRDLVTFKHHNLIDPVWPMRSPFDVIFCRNALIYFDRDEQERVIARLRDRLAPDGVLCLGHAEVPTSSALGLVRGPAPSTYARPGSAWTREARS